MAADGFTFAPPEEALFSAEAEMEILAAAMGDPLECADAMDALRPEAFGDPLHGKLWRVLQGLAQRSRPPLPHAIRDALGDDDALAEWGGVERLSFLRDAGSTHGLADNVATVLDRAQRRGLRKLALGVEAKAGDVSRGSAVELLAELERGASELAASGSTSEHWRDGGDVVREAIAHAQAYGGRIDYPTGLDDVDAMTGGFTAGEVAIIAGRPGMAKSTVALAIAKANASRGVGVPFFSLEMGAPPLGLRMACDLAFQRAGAVYSALPSANLNPTYDRARKNLLRPDQWDRLRDAEAIIREWPLRFDTRPSLTVSQIEACARRQFRAWDRAGIKRGPVIVDHLGIIRPETNRSGNKVAETADISRGLAEMAKRLEIPVVALCQVGRGQEGKEDKRPGLSDLRWSGAIEEDARQVIFLYRPEYYLRPPEDGEDFEAQTEREAKLEKVRRKLFWIVAKNNNGETGQVETFCDVACSAVRNKDPSR